jgi:hypothetical protein
MRIRASRCCGLKRGVKLGYGLLWGGDLLMTWAISWNEINPRYIEITEEIKEAFLNRKRWNE